VDTNFTRGVAEFIAGLKYEDIPAGVVERVKLLVLDAIGVGLLGAGMPWSVRMRQTAREMEAPGDVSVWGTKLRFSTPTAAMCNGVAVHGFEIDDSSAGGHNGSTTLTSTLALAQHKGNTSGKDVITAVVAGMEVASRLQRCLRGLPQGSYGFHEPGLLGTFAAAAAGGKVLGLDPAQCVDALGHAGQQAASLMFTGYGGMGKRMLAGQAARSGSFAALLAANGFTNAPNVFEAEFGGFPAAHTGNQRPPAYDLSQLTRGLGSEWNAGNVTFKMWACRGPNHATLEAITDLRRQHPLPPDEIEKVTIRLAKGGYQNVGWPYTPTTITSAQMNISYVSAIMLLENDVFVDQFTGDKIRSPRVLDMIARINVLHDEELDRNRSGGTPVEVVLRNGARYATVGRRRGDSGANRITDDDVRAKFRKMTGNFWDEAAQTQVIDLCEKLDDLDDARELVGLLTVDLPPLNMEGE
jgi:2-methylcitrate dehydratase PrpD